MTNTGARSTKKRDAAKKDTIAATGSRGRDTLGVFCECHCGYG
jgi:hypothetical protein